MARYIEGLPGVTPEIFREFLELMIGYYVASARERIAEIAGGKSGLFSYEIRDLGLGFQVEVSAEGNCTLHWEPAGEALVAYAADAETFDDMMTTRVSPAAAFLEKRVEVRGSMRDAVGVMSLLPYLQRGYIRARQGIIERHGLEELARDYPVPPDFEERLG